MTVELAEFTEWRISVEARIARLEALYFTRYRHTSIPYDHITDLAGLAAGQQELRREMAEARIGIQTIIGLLNHGGDSVSQPEPS